MPTPPRLPANPVPMNNLFSIRPAFLPSLLVALLLPSFAAVSPGAPANRAEDPARPFLSPIFGDNMVLQRGKPNTFWGWAKPGEKIRVEINGHTGSAMAGADGRWQTQIEPPPVGTECVVTIDGPQHLELRHVIVGDVWLCGGQSNMQFGLGGALGGAGEITAADHPDLRLYTVTPRSGYAPVAAPVGTWKICTPQTVAENGGFSAVAYFFARRVQAETHIPIGLIQDCLGGTPAESWMSPAALRPFKDFDPPLAEIDRLRQARAPEYGNYIMHWYDEYDPGIQGKSWADPDLDDHDWRSVQVPGGFAELGMTDFPAVVWFRKEITLPDPVPAGGATLHLGVVEKMETSYCNGQWIGASSWVENPRAYRIDRSVLKPGRNVLTVRVFKLKSKTGFLSAPEQLHLSFAGGVDLPLAGPWKARLSVDARPPHPLPLGYENYPIMPAVLYQGMIQPLLPLALTGVIWYQGEANSSRAHQYRALLPSMIGDWRAGFQQGDLHFFIAGLPAFQARKTQPGSDDWAELREAQALTAATVAHCGLAVTIDTGEADNIHPKEKKPVGERLALQALAKYYGVKIPCDGPTYRSSERERNAFRVHFDHTDGGLQIHGEKLEEFSLAGSDRHWHWATATIDGDTVVVSSPDVPEPVAVRYAWQANPKATLANGAGLPATPFRSDDWPGVTDQRPPW